MRRVDVVPLIHVQGDHVPAHLVKEVPLLPKWLSAGQNKMFKITDKPIKAVGIAILFHAIWNGSLWTISVALQDTSIGIQIFANLLITFTLIALLWTILRRLVPFAVLE